MDFQALRSVLSSLIGDLKDRVTHQKLADLVESLAMPAPPDTGSKRERLAASLKAIPDASLPEVAKRSLLQLRPSPTARNRLQDLLHPDGSVPSVPMRYRRDAARSLSTIDLFLKHDHFDALLDRLFDLDGSPFFDWAIGKRPTLREEIERHVHRNPDDWTVEYLFERIGVFEASDWRFNSFLEGLASPAVRPDEASQRDFVARVNDALRPCHVELREAGVDGGYPTFVIVSLRAGVSRASPKNIIFASLRKPDLRFRDALNNDLELLSTSPDDDALVYDKPINWATGLPWSDLQSWWAERNCIEDHREAKHSLYSRLKRCLPGSSPPQAALFRAYYQVMSGKLPDAPALLPEVWLLWDPKVIAMRGPEALLHQRMDFLLLLPHGHRVVIEVDGTHHYADADGRASPSRYAAMARGDRELKLAGYEVFRFGGAELNGEGAIREAAVFFTALAKRFI